MPDSPTPPHTRRPRYRGSHPRRFADKYKELAPEQYPEIVAHLRAQGRTPAGQHVPALVSEVIAALAPKPGERGVDATLGWGGHAERLLERVAPGGRLLALDADPIQLPKTEARLRRLGADETALVVRRTNFAGLRSAMDAVGWHDGIDFVCADLGLSSMQIDDPSRGFTFQADGPLDMRINPSRGVSAAAWLQRASADAIADALSANADEPLAADIATALVARRDDRGPGALATTLALAGAVRDLVERRMAAGGVDATIRRVFQAIRIEVNDEFGALEAFLRQVPACLRPGGRVAILTFHSGEDRRVKKAFDAGLAAGVYAEVSRDVIRATVEERRANPRAKAAKLRWARRAP